MARRIRIGVVGAGGIASPDPLHREHILAAFKRGLHVSCEKPLCYSAADIDDVPADLVVAVVSKRQKQAKRTVPAPLDQVACRGWQVRRALQLRIDGCRLRPAPQRNQC